METFAYIQAAVHYEDPNPAPEVTVNLSGSTWAGLAGAAVVASVMTGAPGHATAATVPMSQGSAGAEVQAVQKALGLEVDGQYGAKTEAAVKDFQIRQGLQEIDGVVGQETATALGLNEKYQPTGRVDTYSGVGVNIRSGPGLGYAVVGGGYEGEYLNEVEESVVVNDSYYWRQLDDGGWVATTYTEYDDDYGQDFHYARTPYYAEAEISYVDYEGDTIVEVSAQDVPDNMAEAYDYAYEGDGLSERIASYYYDYDS